MHSPLIRREAKTCLGQESQTVWNDGHVPFRAAQRCVVMVATPRRSRDITSCRTYVVPGRVILYLGDAVRAGFPGSRRGLFCSPLLLPVLTVPVLCSLDQTKVPSQIGHRFQERNQAGNCLGIKKLTIIF
jgi:hypothetical protein